MCFPWTVTPTSLLINSCCPNSPGSPGILTLLLFGMIALSTATEFDKSAELFASSGESALCQASLYCPRYHQNLVLPQPSPNPSFSSNTVRRKSELKLILPTPLISISRVSVEG